jgi:hypothetical protein
MVWLVAGLGLGFFLNMGEPTDVGPPPLLVFPPLFAVWGALGGVVFSTVLAVAERNRRLESLSFIRLAIWGALGGAALPAVLMIYSVIRAEQGIGDFWVAVVTILGVSGLIGAACASGTLALARRSPRSVDRAA